MKVSDNIRRKISGAWLGACLATMALTSCERIYEYEGDCTAYYYVDFMYDRNMKFADAFATEVEAVRLYVFDDEDKFVLQTSEQGDALKQDGYRMKLDLEAGRYTLVAWCGLGGKNESYTLPEMTAGVSTLQELTCRLNDRARDEGQVKVGEIDDLYHGMITVDLPDTYGEHNYTMPLTKNTNYVRVVLQHLSGKDINKDDFIFTITDNNGLLNYDNSLLDDELLTYHAWYTSQGTAGVTGAEETRGEITSVSVALAELTINRLMTDENKDTKTMLTVTRSTPDEDGTYPTVLSIPLVDYALLVKGYYNKELDDQEYLDRQDEYNLTFFLDDNNNWVSSSIIINSWRVVLSDVEM